MNAASSRMDSRTRNLLPSDLADLCLVVEHGGISAAARVVGRPKSSLSLAIRRLEEALSARLIDRSKRRFALTDRGRRLCEETGPLLDELQRITAEFHASSARVAGVLRIAAPYEFGAHHVAPVIARLVARNPQLEVVLGVQYGSPRELFRDGYDVVFVMANGNLDDSDAASCRLFLLERGLFAAPDCLARHPPIRTPEDLCRVPLIPSTQDGSWRLTDGSGGMIEVPVTGSRLASANADVRRRAAIDGLGVTRTVASFCDEAVHEGKLCAVLPAWRNLPLHVYAMVNERRLRPAAVRALLDELEQGAPDLFIEIAARDRADVPGIRPAADPRLGGYKAP